MIRPLSDDCSLLSSLSSVWAPSYTPVMTGGYQVTATEEPASRPITLGRSNSPCLWQKQVPPRPPPEVCARRVDYEQPHLLAHQPLKHSRRSHSSSSPFPQADGVACDKALGLRSQAGLCSIHVSRTAWLRNLQGILGTEPSVGGMSQGKSK